MLNLAQLEQSADSLQEKLDQTKERIDRQLRREGMYHYIKFVSDTLDSVVVSDTLPADFLSSYSLSEQEMLLGSAVSSARRGKNQVSFNGKSVDRQERLIRKHEVEWHRKFTLSFACLVLFFIGAPLGAIIRKGGLGLPLVISIVFFVSYHIISITGEKYAKAGVMSVQEGMWLASVILLPLGIFLTLKATTDAPLLDIESWKKSLGKLIGKKQS